MLKKTYSRKDGTCKVTFSLPAEAGAEEVYLCGDFNDWDKSKHKMRHLKDGRFSISLNLEPGQSYRFRYWLGDNRWENDWEADAYASNNFGSEDSIVEV